MNDTLHVGIVGGGAAGLMAGALLCREGVSVTIYEKNKYPGRKLGITGKGRCNVTNDCTRDDFIASVPGGGRFLYSAFDGFPPRAVMDFFEALGVPLKVERGNRVFPVSDKVGDIVRALERAFTGRWIHEKVTGLTVENGAVTGIETASRRDRYDAVIVATGGLSYPVTGSDGDGYRFAERLGLRLTPCSPSLVPLVVKESWCAAMQGLSLKNTALTVTDTVSGKTVYSDFGEMMFTHFGVTGPMILSASAHLTDIDTGKYRVSLDLKPALDRKTLDLRLLSDFKKYSNRDLANALGDLLPQKMIPVIIRLSGIDPHRKIHEITREERGTLVSLLKELSFTPIRFRPIAEAIVTRGGVSLKELDPKTMRVKSVPGVYFIGEVIDCDAYTGGFNLQIAFCTAACAARAIAASLPHERNLPL